MEPQMIDHYNELPHSVNVIDKMNEELEKEQEKNKKFIKDMNIKPVFLIIGDVDQSIFQFKGVIITYTYISLFLF